MWCHVPFSFWRHLPISGRDFLRGQGDPHAHAPWNTCGAVATRSDVRATLRFETHRFCLKCTHDTRCTGQTQPPQDCSSERPEARWRHLRRSTRGVHTSGIRAMRADQEGCAGAGGDLPRSRPIPRPQGRGGGGVLSHSNPAHDPMQWPRPQHAQQQRGETQGAVEALRAGRLLWFDTSCRGSQRQFEALCP